MDPDYINEDAFWNEWEVIQRANGELFDLNDVQHRPIKHVWTIVESGDAIDQRLFASPGLHIVNRVGYVMTKRTWVSGQSDAVFYDPQSN